MTLGKMPPHDIQPSCIATVHVMRSSHVPWTNHTYYPLFCIHPEYKCAQLVVCCEPVQCREGAMPLTCVLVVAILGSLSTLSQRWRATSLTQNMMETQPCTGQPKRASCPWWSTSWDPVDLMWRQLTRLAYVVCCLSDAFVASQDTPAAWAQ